MCRVFLVPHKRIHIGEFSYVYALNTRSFCRFFMLKNFHEFLNKDLSSYRLCGKMSERLNRRLNDREAELLMDVTGEKR